MIRGEKHERLAIVDVLEYSQTDPPRRRGFAVVGFCVAALSFATTLAYVTILVFKVRTGAQGVTFRLGVVHLIAPVVGCVLCLIGWSRAVRRLSAVGIALAVSSFAIALFMGSRFWP